MTRKYIPNAKKQLQFVASPNTRDSSPTPPTQPLLSSPTATLHNSNDEYDFILSPYKINHLQKQQHNVLQHTKQSIQPIVNDASVDSILTQTSAYSEYIDSNNKVKFSGNDVIHEITHTQLSSNDSSQDGTTHDNKEPDGNIITSDNIMSLIDCDGTDDQLTNSLYIAKSNCIDQLLSPISKPLTASASKLSGSAAKRAGLSSSGNNTKSTSKRQLLSDNNVSGTAKSITIQQQKLKSSRTQPQVMKISSISNRSTLLLQRAQVLAKQPSTHITSSYIPQSPPHDTNKQFSIYDTPLVGSPSPRKVYHINNIMKQHTNAQPTSHDEYQHIHKRNIVLTDKLQQKDNEIYSLQQYINQLKQSIQSNRDDYEFDLNEANETIQRLKDELHSSDNSHTSIHSTNNDSMDTLDTRELQLVAREAELDEREQQLNRLEHTLKQQQYDLTNHSNLLPSVTLHTTSTLSAGGVRKRTRADDAIENISPLNNLLNQNKQELNMMYKQLSASKYNHQRTNKSLLYAT